MFTKMVKTHDIKGARYVKKTDWDAVWGTVVIGVIVIIVIRAFAG